jgi:signal transduction histidine kinase
LGLGLAIVKRLEQLLGYQMQVVSSLGEGTQFTIVIPIPDTIVAPA